MPEPSASAIEDDDKEPNDPGARLRALLTPSGKAFAERLEKVLAREQAAVDNQAMVAIMKHIHSLHLRTRDSIDAMNQLAENRAKVSVTAYYMIMNYANFLICSGKYASGKGELTRTGSYLLTIWSRYARYLADKGEITQERYDAEEKKLRTKIASMGRDGGGFIRAVTSVFRKNK